RRNRGVGLVEREGRAGRRRAVQAVAVVAGDVVLPVLAGIPERQVAVGAVAFKAGLRLRLDGYLWIVEAEDAAHAPAAAFRGVLERGVRVAGDASAVVGRPPDVPLLPVLGRKIALDAVGVTVLADFFRRRLARCRLGNGYGG